MPDDPEEIALADEEQLVEQTDNGPRPEDGDQPEDQHAAPALIPEEDA